MSMHNLFKKKKKNLKSLKYRPIIDVLPIYCNYFPPTLLNAFIRLLHRVLEHTLHPSTPPPNSPTQSMSAATEKFQYSGLLHSDRDIMYTFASCSAPRSPDKCNI